MMIIPEFSASGLYKVLIFNGEGSRPIEGKWYFDGTSWNNPLPETGSHWHPNIRVIEIIK